MDKCLKVTLPVYKLRMSHVLVALHPHFGSDAHWKCFRRSASSTSLSSSSSQILWRFVHLFLGFSCAACELDCVSLSSSAFFSCFDRKPSRYAQQFAAQKKPHKYDFFCVCYCFKERYKLIHQTWRKCNLHLIFNNYRCSSGSFFKND